MIPLRKFLLTIGCVVVLSVNSGATRTFRGGAQNSALSGNLVALTFQEPTGNNQTNMPLTFGLPLAPGAVTSGQSVSVVDGGTTYNCEDDNRASDISTGPRNESVTCIVPSASASAFKTVQASVVNSAPPTGTDISISDLNTYLASISYDLPVAFAAINGASGTWSASMSAVLSSGNSGFINKSTNTVLGKYRSGGGLATEYILLAPAFKSGTADAQLHVIYDLLCYKAARSAVNVSTNPILGCRVDVLIENSWIQTASPIDAYYGLCVGTSCSVANFPNSQPTQTLTLPGTGQNGGNSISASSALFTANSVGVVFANATGVGVINGQPADSTHIPANIYTGFGTTSLTSGNYTFYGINHPYASRYRIRTYFGFAHNPPDVTQGTLYVGNQWNNTSLTGGPGTYFIASKLLPNYTETASQITNDLTNLNALGNNPMSYIGCGYDLIDGSIGDQNCYLEASGEGDGIGIAPYYATAPLIRYDANAATKIFENADRWDMYPSNFRDQNTGLSVSPCNVGTIPTCTGNVNWTVSSSSIGTLVEIPPSVVSPTGSANLSPIAGDGWAHDPEGFYVAALLTGDFSYIESQQMLASNAWMVPNSPANGISKTEYRDPNQCCGLQERGSAWATRTVLDAVLLTPDSSPSVLGISKTVSNAWANAQWDDASYGFNAVFLANTGSGTNYWATNGPHWTVLNNVTDGFAAFQVSYASFEFSHAAEQGMLDTNGIGALDWWLENQVHIATNTDVNGQYAARWEYGGLFDTTSSCPGTQVTSWANSYSASNLVNPANGQVGTNRPLDSGITVTASASSGTSVSLSFSGSKNYFATSGFYPGMWVSTQDGGTFDCVNGCAKIVSVTNANAIVVNTTASQQLFPIGCATFTGSSFTSTTMTGDKLSTPVAPSDPVAGFYPPDSSNGSEYLQLTQVGTIYGYQFGLTNGSAAMTNSLGWTGGSIVGSPFLKWNIAPR